MSFGDKVRKWYDGERVPYQNEPGSGIIFLGWDEKRHWTAEVARVLVRFWLAHWQWTLGFVLAVAGLLVTVFR
jgi:hypothetical protein